MLNINILSTSEVNKFQTHWDIENYPKEEYNIEYNSSKDIIWDIVVVYENLNKQFVLKCREGGLVYFSGEPPMMHPLPKKYIDNFDVIVTPDKKIRHRNKILSHGFLNWFVGYSFKNKSCRFTYSELYSLEILKAKPISVISSSKEMMPGHEMRVKTIKSLQRDFPGLIDIYGRGYNELDDKGDGLFPYYFHLCMENSVTSDYWTEKFADPLLAKAIPIYIGCNNISKYFPDGGYISLTYNEYNKLKSLIQRILENPQKEYEKYYDAMMLSRERLMKRENIIPFLIKIGRGLTNYEYKTHVLSPLTISPLHPSYLFLRIKRYVMKLYNKKINIE